MVADVAGVTREAEAWFRVHRERRHLEWGSEGPDNYHGYRGIAGTLAEIKQLVEADPAPGPPTERPDERGRGNGGTAGGLSAGRRRDRPEDYYAGPACDRLASAATWSHSSRRAASSSAPAPIR